MKPSVEVKRSDPAVDSKPCSALWVLVLDDYILGPLQLRKPLIDSFGGAEWHLVQ